MWVDGERRGQVEKDSIAKHMRPAAQLEAQTVMPKLLCLTAPVPHGPSHKNCPGIFGHDDMRHVKLSRTGTLYAPTNIFGGHQQMPDLSM